MIFNEGMYLGFAFFLSWISECNLARILFAMAVPSIFWAVMADVEKAALPRSSESLPTVRGGTVRESRVILLLWRVSGKTVLEVEAKKDGEVKGRAENKVLVFVAGAGGQNRGVRAARAPRVIAGRTRCWSGSAEARCLAFTQAESGPELLAKGP